jgi:hypothetical protein
VQDAHDQPYLVKCCVVVGVCVAVSGLMYIPTFLE